MMKATAVNGTPGLSNGPSSTLGGLGSQQPVRPSPAPGLTHPSQLQAQQQQQQPTLQKLGAINGDNPARSTLGLAGPSNAVSEDERFGLSGLFNAMRGDAGEGSSLAKGQDLMMLGFDINSSE